MANTRPMNLSMKSADAISAMPAQPTSTRLDSITLNRTPGVQPAAKVCTQVMRESTAP
ncbi:hypothetical protein QE440_004366 [Pseudomonas psychrotolerans]|uniref:Uncharacterized protein n=1 Tax=Pseudomonas oryzihabitans TaxID=47885 RepID=A0AAJ2F1N4_9PSED|nr:hypothetical protein [Pseudomonas psychrotolerans]